MRGTPFAASVLVHSALVAMVVVVPLLSDDALPGPDVSGFFAEPLVIAAPPPPPPPPPPGIGHVQRRSAPTARQVQTFVVPTDGSREVQRDAIDLGPVGADDGVPGGVPDGVIGAIVVGLPPAAPPVPARVVRISSLAAPKLVRKVAPAYPELALAARVSGVVVLEAQVDTRGSVTSVRIVSGHPLLKSAALEAVRQWRYQPTTLNGDPVEVDTQIQVVFTLGG